MEQITPSRTNPAPSYGLIAGLIITVITLLQYLGGVGTFTSPLSYISYLVLITMAVLAALKVRRENEGWLEFRQALKITFTVFVIAMFIQTVFSYILFNFIDVSFKEALNQEIMNKTEQMLTKMGLSQNQIDEALEQQRNSDSFSLPKMLLGFAATCIVAFIFCLLISLIVKKSKPAFNNTI